MIRKNICIKQMSSETSVMEKRIERLERCIEQLEKRIKYLEDEKKILDNDPKLCPCPKCNGRYLY